MSDLINLTILYSSIRGSWEKILVILPVDTTIGRLKELIQGGTKIPPQSQHITFRSNLLNDGDTIRSIGIVSHDILELDRFSPMIEPSIGSSMPNPVLLQKSPLSSPSSTVPLPSTSFTSSMYGTYMLPSPSLTSSPPFPSPPASPPQPLPLPPTQRLPPPRSSLPTPPPPTPSPPPPPPLPLISEEDFEGGFPITIQCLSESKKFELKVKMDTSGLILKLRIHAKLYASAPGDLGRLVFAGKEVKDEDTVASYNLHKGCTLHYLPHRT